MEMQPCLQFHFHTSTGQPEYHCFYDPVAVIETYDLNEVRECLRQVRERTEAGYYAAGFVSYDAAPAFDAALQARAATDFPLLWFGIFKEPKPPLTLSSKMPSSLSDWQAEITREEYDAGLRAIRHAIAAGETYQVNYTFRLRAAWQSDLLAYYRAICTTQNAGYAAYLNIGRYCVLSASPELFLEIQGDRLLTRPMKGTARRGRWEAEDQAIASELQSSEKERAENIMIVDLMRNDLGRVAATGSVRVASLFDVEALNTVWQMTSTVEALQTSGTSLEQIFDATFPPGSVTGAPKAHTTHIIAAQERSPRKLYCGTIGFLTPSNYALFNVAIRTVIVDRDKGVAECGVGGGVTWDSTAEGEYTEAFLKARFLTQPIPEFELLETLRLENGIFLLLEQHLHRLRRSAAYFTYSLNISRVSERLAECARTYPAGIWRVRLRVAQTGEVYIETYPFADASEEPQTVVLAREPISANDPFLFHKTTFRDIYRKHGMDRGDAFDVLLWNEAGRLTEFTTGNLVVELQGRLYTPPVEDGLLAGTCRADLLERGVITERSIERSDLSAISRLWFINSVRGWIEVRLVT